MFGLVAAISAVVFRPWEFERVKRTARQLPPLGEPGACAAEFATSAVFDDPDARRDLEGLGALFARARRPPLLTAIIQISLSALNRRSSTVATGSAAAQGCAARTRSSETSARSLLPADARSISAHARRPLRASLWDVLHRLMCRRGRSSHVDACRRPPRSHPTRIPSASLLSPSRSSVALARCSRKMADSRCVGRTRCECPHANTLI